MKFSDFPIQDRIKEQLANLGFKRPTDIQFKAIKHILNGEDVMAVAQTGTGKTTAFAMPILHKLEPQPLTERKKISALILCKSHFPACYIWG